MAVPFGKVNHETAGRNGTADGPLASALAYLRAGLSVIPIRTDGSKRPAVKWERFQAAPPSEDDVRASWREERGIAVIGGRVSGNAECIDFDRGELFAPWCELVEAQAPGLVARLCVVRTPGDGNHAWYRCPGIAIPGNTKLAMEPGTDPKTGKPTRATLIETRGEGGYALTPGSPAACHPSGRTYDHIAGPPLTALSGITPQEREALIASARSFDLMGSAGKGATPKAEQDGAGLRPGDDYNFRGPDWAEIIGAHGWEQAHQRGVVVYWRRPGKEDPGWSATTGYCRGKDGADLLAVFSSNADPFEGPTGTRSCSCYSKFAAYTLLNHGGDYKAAAKELAAQGYGEQWRKAAGPSGLNGQADGHAGANGESDGAAAASGSKGDVRLGPLFLRAGQARRTKQAQKLTFQVEVYRAGRQVDEVPYTNTNNGRREVSRRLAGHLADASDYEKVDGALSELLVRALAQLQEEANGECPQMLDLVRARVQDALGIRCRTDRGLWSETRREELVRHDFVTHSPRWLLEEAAAWLKVPKGTDPLCCLKDVEAALRVLYADLRERLPHLRDVDLGSDSAAADRLRGIVFRAWVNTVTFELTGGANRETAARSSLIERVRTQSKGHKPGVDPGGWREAQKSFMGWWRGQVSEDGEVVYWLAMHYELFHQMKVQLPDVHNQTELVTVGRRFGIFDPNPPVPSRLTGGGRVAVLARNLTRELFQTLADDADDADDVPSVTPAGGCH